MERGKAFCSLWKRSKHPVSCTITPKPYSMRFLAKDVQEGKFSSLYEHSFFLLLYGLDMTGPLEVSCVEALLPVKVLLKGNWRVSLVNMYVD